jgi:cytochrome c-type biogenesis protein CcmH
MNGWVTLFILAFSVFAGLVLIGRLPRKTWEPLAAVLVLGMAGYAYQGRPSLQDAPRQPLSRKGQEAAALIAMRVDMDQHFGIANKWLVTADAFSRSGDYELAADYIKSGLRQYPRNADLWSGLGLQLMLASNGKMSAPAKFAFDRARKLQPTAPAPDYFEGLSALFEGRVIEAVKLWQGLIDTAPKNAKWKPRLESQVNGVLQMAQRMSQEEANNPPSN